MDDPLQNKFVSNHTQKQRCNVSKSDESINSLMNTLNIHPNTPSVAFTSVPRPELFNLDKIAKENEFSKIETDSLIFEANSRYWIRDNVGFKMPKIPKKYKMN